MQILGRFEKCLIYFNRETVMKTLVLFERHPWAAAVSVALIVVQLMDHKAHSFLVKPHRGLERVCLATRERAKLEKFSEMTRQTD